jgi:predicted aspartyl protease
VISGTVSEEGVPASTIKVALQEWTAVLDTGFNGDLELPLALRGKFNDQPVGRVKSALAGGQIIEEDAYLVDFSFDDRIVPAVATFVASSQILIGTNLIREYHLQIRFASRVVQLDRE